MKRLLVLLALVVGVVALPPLFHFQKPDRPQALFCRFSRSMIFHPFLLSYYASVAVKVTVPDFSPITETCRSV